MAGGFSGLMALLVCDIAGLCHLIGTTECVWHIFNHEFSRCDVATYELLFDLDADVFGTSDILAYDVVYLQQISIYSGEAVEHPHLFIVESALHKPAFETLAFQPQRILIGFK